MIKSIIKKYISWQLLLGVILVIAVVLRLFRLGQTGLFFYDEALYLDHSLEGLEFLARNKAAVAADPLKAALFYLQFPLNFTKPIWMFIVDSRYFFTHIHDWDYAKYASCLFGVLTLPLAFFFARKFFHSLAVAVLSVAILALMPGHVFYSRVGMQEALSTFLVLGGFYFYLLPRQFGPRTFFAGLLLGAAYLSNYRLILLPGLLVAVELWLGLFNKEGIRGRHFIWTCVTFLAVMVLVGGLMGGAQMRYTFAWVFHQQEMAADGHSWFALLAYPYYLFRLENVFLAAAFFASVYFIIKRNLGFSLLFVVTCLQMIFFSLASDQGVRYIAVMLPFVAMSAAALMCTAYQDSRLPNKKFIAVAVVVMMFVGMAVKTGNLISASSAHRPAVEFLLAQGETVKFLSSQRIVQRLYMEDRSAVRDIPGGFQDFYRYYTQGFRYLVLDPQAYISLSADGRKWGSPLKGYLGFIDEKALPVRSFPHFNRAVMERVVFEHSNDLLQSIRFLRSKDIERMSALKVYDMSALIPVMATMLSHSRQK